MRYLWKLKKALLAITLLISTMMFSGPCWAANPKSDNVQASANARKVLLSFLCYQQYFFIIKRICYDNPL